MRVAIANQKGGVGKTTTAVNLAAALAGLGHRILLVDLDPQSNATTGVGLDHRSLDRSAYDVIVEGRAVEDVISETPYERLDVLPSSIDLAGAELELVPAFARESKLRVALEPVTETYEVIFIDCPPSLGLLTVNALTAADWMLVPIQCEYYALEGLTQLLRNVELVRTGLNARLEIGGILLTMYDARTKLSEQVADEVRNHFGDRVFSTVVPRSVRLSEAPSYGQPAVTYDPSSRGSLAYRWLAEEFASRFLGMEPSPERAPAVVAEAAGHAGGVAEVHMPADPPQPQTHEAPEPHDPLEEAPIDTGYVQPAWSDRESQAVEGVGDEDSSSTDPAGELEPDSSRNDNVEGWPRPQADEDRGGTEGDETR